MSTPHTADVYIDGRNVATFRDRGHCWEFISAYLYANRQSKVTLKDDRGERAYYWDAVNNRIDIKEIDHGTDAMPAFAW